MMASMPKASLNYEGGIHPHVFAGALTDIVERFKSLGNKVNDISQLCI